MLAAQLAQPPATNHTIVGFPRSALIVAVVPEAVVKVPLGAGVPTVDVRVDEDAEPETDAAECSVAADWILALTGLLPLLASA